MIGQYGIKTSIHKINAHKSGKERMIYYFYWKKK